MYNKTKWSIYIVSTVHKVYKCALHEYICIIIQYINDTVCKFI